LVALGEVLGEEEDEDEGGEEPVRRVGARPAMVLAAATLVLEALAVVVAPWEGTSSLFPILPLARWVGGGWSGSESLSPVFVCVCVWEGSGVVSVCMEGMEIHVGVPRSMEGGEGGGLLFGVGKKDGDAMTKQG